ncbi:uncharacterized protein LOC133799663 [Humulus lupulus]|uniref:uncharacterized protein LOC133799663 n=1 Tax=Humulus lupulus TaxID=3486 RepID=UPI002B40B480|nr:uncharacterized protein LOC133799663 [Humulus lupulus]
MASATSPQDSSSVSHGETTPVPPVTDVSSQSTMAPMVSISALSPPTLPSLPSVNQPIVVKLDEHNFVVWQNQMLNIIIVNGLEDFVNGTHPCPDPNASNPVDPVNLTVQTWHWYNRLVMSWIYASINESMLGQIVGYRTAADICLALEQIYVAAYLSQIFEIRTQLQTLKKDGLTAFAYIQKFRVLCNILASAGELVSYIDQLLYFLNDLGREYNAYVSPIQA